MACAGTGGIQFAMIVSALNHGGVLEAELDRGQFACFAQRYLIPRKGPSSEADVSCIENYSTRLYKLDTTYLFSIGIPQLTCIFTQHVQLRQPGKMPSPMLLPYEYY
jgi:hypothetical protein